ncbi:hypothetical protein SISSUDRAFT_1046995, partial [Sistotremastrum suecicum HHB10207 ss-3]
MASASSYYTHNDNNTETGHPFYTPFVDVADDINVYHQQNMSNILPTDRGTEQVIEKPARRFFEIDGVSS